MKRVRRTHDTYRARRAIERAASELGLSDFHVERVRSVGGGLSRKAFAGVVERKEEEKPCALVALVPREGAPRRSLEAVEREARLLRFLARPEIGVRVPGHAVVVPDEDGDVLVCEAVEGLRVDLRDGRMESIVPWELVGSVAAKVHGIPVEELGWLGGYATRREHGRRAVEGLEGLEGAEDADVRRALGWLRENLPPDEPARLLHGDLLGQNLLLGFADTPIGSPVLLDWELAQLGDPAYDLAIVTRGVRRPFQVEGGMDKLLRAYRRYSGRQLSENQVRFHEICLHVAWYGSSASGTPESEPVPQILARLKNLLRAVGRKPRSG